MRRGLLAAIGRRVISPLLRRWDAPAGAYLLNESGNRLTLQGGDPLVVG